MFRVVIPARYASTRLPGKPLRTLAGRPMLQHVYERAARSGAQEVWIATDDARIESACQKFGARVMMTDVAHRSGTDRIAEVARNLRWPDDDIVVNVQGDEPLIPPAIVRQVAELLERSKWAGIATLATPIESLDEFRDVNVVKVVATQEGRALYFSRAPIPWPRDAAGQSITSPAQYQGARRHLGLYAYRVRVLAQVAALAPTVLEEREKLEQLRALEHGIQIAVATASEPPGRGVDTETDLAAVAHLLAT
ncbi:MAG TPA: 3-deoxy-manno-octulosonate cytidylyltransferase [Steroidobacteraceae bacterium]|jgi:3-deoxy-manno-octulosonate cytidylyltransferase (CMP-KDO synthetase)